MAIPIILQTAATLRLFIFSPDQVPLLRCITIPKNWSTKPLAIKMGQTQYDRGKR
jgi:hypothetical protein